MNNYVFTIFRDGSYNQWIIRYPILEDGNYNMDEIEAYKLHDPSLISFGVTSPVLTFQYCYSTVMITVEVPCGGETGSGKHMPGQNCNAAPEDQPKINRVETIKIIPCPSSGGGGPSGPGTAGDYSGTISGNQKGGSFPDPNETPGEEDPGEGDLNECLTLGSGCDGIVLNPLDPDEPDPDDEECEKIKAVLKDENGDDTAFKDKILSYLASNDALNNDKERAVFKVEGVNQLAYGKATGNDPKISIEYSNFSESMKAFAHNHPAIGSGTLSIFGLDDLEAIAILSHADLLSDDFVAFLPTKKGTQYAFTIRYPNKLFDFFYSRYVDSYLETGNSINYQKYLNSRDNYNKLHKEYFKQANPERKIKKTDTNENVLKEFLNFLEEADAGISLFEATDNTFEEFKPVTLDNGQPSRGEPCE